MAWAFTVPQPRRDKTASPMPDFGATLEEATGIAAKAEKGGGLVTPLRQQLLPGFSVKFPSDQVVAVDRVGVWADDDYVRMSMWPAELKRQYTRVYSDPANVEALIELGSRTGWTLNSNFHLAYRFAAPSQRWYPGRHLPGGVYMRQWIDDFHAGCAGGRARDEVADPGFFRWLVARGYARRSELASLNDWLNSKAPGIQIHIRPSIQILRTWPSADAFAQDRDGEFAAELRSAIDRVLAALGEPELHRMTHG